MKKPRELRRQMALSIAGTVLLIWAVLMLFLIGAETRKAELEMGVAVADVRQSARRIYQAIKDNGETEQAQANSLAYELSQYSTAADEQNGAVVFRAFFDGSNETARSQLAFGVAFSEGYYRGDRYYLFFDGGMDDADQLAYARWVLDNREARISFTIFPSDAERTPGDGTKALITGAVEENGIRVAKVVLRHPDGSEETIVETDPAWLAGEELITVEFPYMELSSALMPRMWFQGGGKHYNSFTHLESRLAHFKSAEAFMDAELAGNPPRPDEGRGSGSIGNGNSGYEYNMESPDERVYLALGWEFSAPWTAIRGLLPVIAITFSITLLLAWFLARKLSSRLSQPLEELTCDAQAGRPCAEQGPIVEVNALATAFNTAQRKMADDLKREQDLTRAVAHELKTPLAILRSHAEALREDIDPAKRGQYLDIIMDESDRMAALVGELLDLARMEAGAETLNREPVDLKALTERVFAPLQNLAPITLKLEPITVSADPKLLERAISNYASNALRHRAEDGEIRVTLRAEGGNALLTVENDGPPIPTEALAHIWDTFYKADAARTRGQGTGLGLAIVKSITALHGGSCTAENTPTGVAFTLSTPTVAKLGLR